MTVNTDAPAYMVDGVLTDGEPWVALQSHVLSADATGVTFQSSTGANDWSQYMDLVIIGYGQSDTEGSVISRYNNDTGNNYCYQEWYGNGSSFGAYQSGALGYNFVGYCLKVADGQMISRCLKSIFLILILENIELQHLNMLPIKVVGVM